MELRPDFFAPPDHWVAMETPVLFPAEKLRTGNIAGEKPPTDNFISAKLPKTDNIAGKKCPKLHTLPANAPNCRVFTYPHSKIDHCVRAKPEESVHTICTPGTRHFGQEGVFRKKIFVLLSAGSRGARVYSDPGQNSMCARAFQKEDVFPLHAARSASLRAARAFWAQGELHCFAMTRKKSAASRGCTHVLPRRSPCANGCACFPYGLRARGVALRIFTPMPIGAS